MAQITIKDVGTFDVPDDKRLVLAIEDADVDILHRCGGYAGCTTCRVTFSDGEPDTMTQAELNKLTEIEKLGEFRLSCQILCDHDMSVEPLMRVSTTSYEDAGGRPKDDITPEAEWVEKP
ncbi:MAG: 2Fe-2S iron-sulfur cluster-binding protein [Phototrophicaceae bacterium]